MTAFTKHTLQPKRNRFLAVIFPFVLLLMLVACEKESSSPAVSEADQSIDFRAEKGKIDVCHYSEEDNTWHVINISESAWPAHEAHGDARLEDQDGDGWVAAVNECVPGGDCDDQDAEVNPGADETPYNGKDDDCNPGTPDDDLDGDGYVLAEDCDDQNAAINPGASKVCDNGVDDDCDGDVDEADGDCDGPAPLTVTLPDGSTLYVHPEDQVTGHPTPDYIFWATPEKGIWDIPGLDNAATAAEALADFNGAANTQVIIDALGDGYSFN